MTSMTLTASAAPASTRNVNKRVLFVLTLAVLATCVVGLCLVGALSGNPVLLVAAGITTAAAAYFGAWETLSRLDRIA